ncbi:hypothetical protein CLOM_g4706 [Closterium sp. NIES-68]|nr:hypothetical protein CLOM_g4706 [Closterium sp. NIES-68]
MGKRPIKLTAKMSGAGGLGSRLRGGNVRRGGIAGGRALQAVGGSNTRGVDSPETVAVGDDQPALKTGTDVVGLAPTAVAEPSGEVGDAAPMGVQLNADDFSDEEEEEQWAPRQEEGARPIKPSGEARRDTMNSIAARSEAAPSTPSPAQSPLEGVRAAATGDGVAQTADGRLADLERTAREQTELITSLLRQVNAARGSTQDEAASGHAVGSPIASGAPRSVPTSQRTAVQSGERGLLQSLATDLPTRPSLNGQVCDMVLHTSLSGIPLRDQILMRQLPAYGKAWNKKMELAVVVAMFRQPDDQSSVYPSESLMMQCLIGVWGEAKGPALGAVMMYCPARAGSAKRKPNDWRARLSMFGRRVFADAFGLACEANPRLKFDYSELVCDEEHTPTQGGLLRWHIAEEILRPFATALFDLIVRNAFQKGAGGLATVVKAYHIAYILYLVEYAVVHHKARGKHIPTDACVNADDIATYHRKVKAAIRKTLKESSDDQLPAWDEKHQGWVIRAHGDGHHLGQRVPGPGPRRC